MNSELWGPPLAVHKASKLALAVQSLLAVGALYLSWAAFEARAADWNLYLGVYLSLAAVFLALAWWTFSRQVRLYEQGLVYKSVFGEKEIEWPEVQKFYYSATKQSVNFIPVGTYYNFRLQGRGGEKIRMGSGLARMEQLGHRLIELTSPPLMRKMIEYYNSGEELDFGPIKVRRLEGIRVGKFIGSKTIPWAEVLEYRIEGGEFYVWRVGEKRTTGTSIAEIPNVFVLLGLLDSVFQRPAEPAPAAQG